MKTRIVKIGLVASALILMMTTLIIASGLEIAVACGGGGCGQGANIGQVVEYLCSINSSMKLLSYAVIALVVVQLVAVIALIRKK